MTACRLIEADLMTDAVEIEKEREQMDRALEEEGLLAFGEVDVVPEFENGVIGVVQANGIAGLQSNTVMVGWPSKPERLEMWLRIMRAVSKTGRSTVIVRLNWRHEPGRKKRVDLWWGGLQNNGDLMLLLALLLTLHDELSDASVVVRSIVQSEEERAAQTERLQALLAEVRIEAETEIILRPEGASIADVIREQSEDADLVFLGLNDPDPGTTAEYAERLANLTSGLGTTVFVRNAGEFAGRLVGAPE